MFTGLVLGLAHVKEFALNEGVAKLSLLCSQLELFSVKLGGSVSVNGVCLSVVTKQSVLGGVLLSFDVSEETLTRSNLGSLRLESKVHVEASLKMGDELGGHLVSGHVDGKASVLNKSLRGQYVILNFQVAPQSLEKIAPFLIEKGSIAIDGVSLTVNSVEEDLKKRESVFSVMLIPETLKKTNFGDLEPGDQVNLEADMLAKYVCKYQAASKELSL
ncbi:riboflavin synthase [bacterium]|nr:riboflavin synthase [bacterium]